MSRVVVAEATVPTLNMLVPVGELSLKSKVPAVPEQTMLRPVSYTHLRAHET